MLSNLGLHVKITEAEGVRRNRVFKIKLLEINVERTLRE